VQNIFGLTPLVRMVTTLGGIYDTTLMVAIDLTFAIGVIEILGLSVTWKKSL
jgi:hypothetical protein